MKSCVSMGLLSALVLFACERSSSERVRPAPAWVLRTDFEVTGSRPAFDGNVELTVAITNTSSSPLVIDRMDQDQRVLLARADGASSRLHPLSVGVAKPIHVHASEKVVTSLLFRPLAGGASELKIYDEVVPVGGSAVGGGKL